MARIGVVAGVALEITHLWHARRQRAHSTMSRSHPTIGSPGMGQWGTATNMKWGLHGVATIEDRDTTINITHEYPINILNLAGKWFWYNCRLLPRLICNGLLMGIKVSNHQIQRLCTFKTVPSHGPKDSLCEMGMLGCTVAEALHQVTERTVPSTMFSNKKKLQILTWLNLSPLNHYSHYGWGGLHHRFGGKRCRTNASPVLSVVSR